MQASSTRSVSMSDKFWLISFNFPLFESQTIFCGHFRIIFITDIYIGVDQDAKNKTFTL